MTKQKSDNFFLELIGASKKCTKCVFWALYGASIKRTENVELIIKNIFLFCAIFANPKLKNDGLMRQWQKTK
jgi:hypothetical protein